MRRTYTREEYLEKIALIRAARRPISVTSDIIIGYPGESDEDFADTLSLLDAAQYDSVYAFQFSPRPNTEALHLTNTVPEEERAKRLTILQDSQREIQLARNQALIGHTLEVLVDGAARKPGQWLGRTSSNRMVNFASSQPNLLGQYVSISITSAGPGNLVGDPAASG
jgi:tRNA-2-methylthio-N6-dimethylallyladenosine synthase